MPITIEDSGAVDQNYLQRSVRINRRTIAASDLTFKVRVDGAAVPSLDVGELVFVKEDSTKIFGGIVVTYDDDDIQLTTGTQRQITYQATSFNILPSRRVFAKTYTSEITAGEIVIDIIDDVLAAEGVTAGTIESGATISGIPFNYRKANRVLDELAELSGYVWYIDSDRALHFRSRTSLTAPWSIDTTTGTDAPYESFRVRRTLGRYRNVQYLRAGEDALVEITEDFVGDGERNTFTVGFPIGDISSITVNGAAQTFAIFSNDSGADWFYQERENQIINNTGTVLTSTDTLVVTYGASVPILIRQENSTEITNRAAIEGTSGIYEDVEIDQDIDSIDTAETKTEALLRRYSEVTKTVTFTTAKRGLIPGQLFTVNVPAQNINHEAFLIDTIEEYQRGATDTGKETLVSKVTLLSGESFGGWINFFERLVEKRVDTISQANELLLILSQLIDYNVVSENVEAVEETEWRYDSSYYNLACYQ